MSDAPAPFVARPLVRTFGVLAILAYLPAITAAPGRMPADSKLYLYLDPGRLMGDAAGTFDPRQFAGWVPHQHIAYLWPSGPWFWLFEQLGVPDWVAHRLWIGTIMLVAGLGVRWCARLLGLSALAAFVAALVYQVSPYVLPYVSRTSVMLLPWAGLGWIVAFTARAARRHTWGDPAAVALIVLTVGAVNATALAMIVPAPALWLVHAGWQRSATWRQIVVVVARVGVLAIGVSLWWIVMLVVQGRYGADVLPYSESLADVSLTATAPEVWRGLGYWLFYIRDPYAATTTASLRYLTSTPAIVVSYLVPVACLAGIVWVRWAHRRYAALLVVAGVLLSVGVHPVGDRSPLMRLVAGDDEGGLALALRSSTRALPLMYLGLALAAGSLVTALAERPTWRFPRLAAGRVVAILVAVLVVADLPALGTGAFVDPALERDETPPAAWREAAGALDRTGVESRVLQLPGEEFGAYRWGYTVDQPLPGLSEKPLITRDLLPLGSPAAMDLLYALDDRIQEGVLEPTSLAPIARLLGVDTMWLTNDIAFDRFRTARPEVVRALIAGAPGVTEPRAFGPPFVNRPDIPDTDGLALGDPRVGSPMAPVELVELVDAGSVIRAHGPTVVVSGSGDGLVDAAAVGLIDGGSAAVRYSADLDDLPAGAPLIVTDTNRDQARQWRSSQDTRGFTESTSTALDVLTPVPSDHRLPVFADDRPDTRTVADQVGPIRATASAYGEPFAYLPEHRPAMAVDGDPDTAWIVGEHGDPVGERLRLYLDEGLSELRVRQPASAGARRIIEVTVSGVGAGEADDVTSRRVVLDDRSVSEAGQPIELQGSLREVDIVIEAVGGGDPGTAGAVAGVGFAEVALHVEPTREVVRPPRDGLDRAAPDTPLALVLTRLRHDPMDRWRDDPEAALVREFGLPQPRRLVPELTVRIDARAGDDELAALFGWPVVASSRLLGSPRNAGVAAFDGDPATAWITEFGDPRGASVAVEPSVDSLGEPIASMTVQQPVTGFSRVTSVRVVSGGEARTIELRPDALGVATATIDPPLPAGPVTIEITDVESATTVDRRFGDVFVLPAAITEFEFAGAPAVARLGSATTSLECVPIARLDGDEVDVSIDIAGSGWLDGQALTTTSCTSILDLGAGTHRLTAIDAGVPIELDRVVLDDGVRAPDAAPDGVVATVTERSRFERTITVTGCDAGCWLVLGEGFNTAWAASVVGRDLGKPVLIDGGFNGWRLAPSASPVVVEVRWTVQRPLTLALWASVVTALLAIGLVANDLVRRRHAVTVAERVGPVIDRPDRLVGARRSVVVAAVWTLSGGVLIGPGWALAGAVAGAAVVATRRTRLPELTTIASVVTIGVGTAFVEWRDAPFPGGGWPAAFESLHGFGMFAMVSLLVAALTADDAAIVAVGRHDSGTDPVPVAGR